jgi:hypothetical protein
MKAGTTRVRKMPGDDTRAWQQARGFGSKCALCGGSGYVDRPCGCPQNSGVECLCVQAETCPNCRGRGAVDKQKA